MFTFYAFRDGRRLQTAASRSRSTKNLNSDGSSAIFGSMFFGCKYVATLLLGDTTWFPLPGGWDLTRLSKEVKYQMFMTRNFLLSYSKELSK